MIRKRFLQDTMQPVRIERPTHSGSNMLNTSRFTNSVLSVGMLVLFAATTARAQLPFDFRTLSLPESTGARAYNINNDGTIAGRVDSSDGVSRGFIYGTDGTVVLFDGPDGQSPFSELYAVNTGGQSAVYISNADFSQFDAFRREADGSLVSVNYVAAPGPSNFAIDMTEAGDVLVQGDGITFMHYLDGTQQTLNVEGYTVNAGWGANDAGEVVGVAWPGFFDVPNGLIYNLGSDTFEIWNYPGAAETSFHDINNAGTIVGSTVLGFGEAEQAFIRHSDGTLQSIEFPGAVSTRLWGINDDGLLAGSYVDSSDVTHAFYATPVPEPSSILFLAISVLMMGSMIRTERS